MKHGELTRDLVKGAVAGAVATWVMGEATTYLYKKESTEAHLREKEANDGETSLHVAAKKLAGLFGVELTRKQRGQLGRAIHWTIGIGSGAVYGALRPRVRWAAEAQGLGFGTAFWLTVDEGLNPLLGLSRGPKAYPWQSHARGLAGHLTFGLVADTTLDLLDRVV